MIVTFISQCEKKAIKRTRKILDAFANRIGDNVWQTNITEIGLKTVYELLKSTASKSTAVACHRIATRHRTELVWVVGNKSKFNATGGIAVNRTKRSILHHDWENNWQFLDGIGIIATLAGLLHDIGKSTIGFQNKLFATANISDPYRHEWVSLKLIVWLVGDCTSDQAVFDRLAHIDEYLADKALPTLSDFGTLDKADMGQLPPLTKWIIWLVVTHHRLPPTHAYYFKNPQSFSTPDYLSGDVQSYLANLEAKERWVSNKGNKADDFFHFKQFILHNKLWQKQLKRYATKAQNSPYLQILIKQHPQAVSDPFLLHLSRLSLMTADHNYSSLKANDKKRLWGKFNQNLTANTTKTDDGKQTQTKQTLDEHLLGVAQFTAQFVRILPTLHENLPTLQNHNPLLQNTDTDGFLWQNTAFKTALKHRETSDTHGFFGINMASTGKGKTLANARIMYALTDPNKGARLTVALGLRVLTLQTGQSLRQKLALTDKELAVLVGGLAQKQLFELQNSDNDTEIGSDTGSESAQRLLDEFVDSDIDTDLGELNLGTLVESDHAKRLIASPVAVCTIDHLMQASECKRGGRYIVPMLRLFSSDVIFDEPDDFDQNDLPALSRLVHLAGLFGSRVMLSSATLPPDLVAGLFKAYQSGRMIYNANFGKPTPKVVCAWFDENTSKAVQVADDFDTHHGQFIKGRVKHLNDEPARHWGEILPIDEVDNEDDDELYKDMAGVLFDKAKALHDLHHTQIHDKTVSIGLIRMANINPLIAIAKAMHETGDMKGFDDCQFYLACYHARQVLILRNQLEVRLDNLLNRHDPKALANNPDIIDNLAKHPNKTHHIFMVLATPVAEVGRDHDYDWAMIEPSSMRSIIQTAGRVWRHRTDKVAVAPNIAIWDKNIKGLKGEQITFCRPGFESERFPLATHQASRLIKRADYERISSVARISKSTTPEPKKNLVDLEHAVMQDLMNNDGINVVNAYHKPDTANRLRVHLSCLTPFRKNQKDTHKDKDFIVNPLDNTLNISSYESVEMNGVANAKETHEIIPKAITCQNPNLDTWLTANLSDELAKLREHYPDTSVNTLIIRFCVLTIRDDSHDGYYFDERFGVYKR